MVESRRSPHIYHVIVPPTNRRIKYEAAAARRVKYWTKLMHTASIDVCINWSEKCMKSENEGRAACHKKQLTFYRQRFMGILGATRLSLPRQRPDCGSGSGALIPTCFNHHYGCLMSIARLRQTSRETSFNHGTSEGPSGLVNLIARGLRIYTKWRVPCRVHKKPTQDGTEVSRVY